MAKAKKKYPISSLGRRVQFYPMPRYFKLFTAYTKANEMGNSEAANVMVRNFFDAMPESEKARILQLAQERG